MTEGEWRVHIIHFALTEDPEGAPQRIGVRTLNVHKRSEKLALAKLF
jgi:hypothetical protein